MFSAVSGRLSRETVPDIKDDDIFRAIADATLIYSNDRPRSLAQDVDGDGSSLYSVAGRLDEWIDGFSVVHRIRYPLTSATIRPPTLDPDCYDIDRRPDGLYLVFYASRPGRSPFRVEYSTRHLPDLSTVPVTDQTALQNLILSLILDQVATAKASEIIPSIEGDTFDRANQSRRYRDSAKMYRDLYREFIGVDGGGNEGGRGETPAGAQASFSQQRYRRRPLTH